MRGVTEYGVGYFGMGVEEDLFHAGRWHGCPCCWFEDELKIGASAPVS